MAELYFGKYTCEYNRVNKEPFITWNETSENLRIEENGTNEDEYIFTYNAPMIEMEQYNYCWIDGKNFFLEPIEAVNGNMCRLKATLDVLYQNATAIYNSNQLVERNAKFVNGYLNDPLIPNASYETCEVYAFPNKMNNDSIVLITVG